MRIFSAFGRDTKRHFSQRFYDIMTAVMAVTLYLDVLLLSNFWLDFALLRACGRMTGSPLRCLRLVLGGMIGAAGSLAVLLPSQPLLLCILGRVMLAGGMVSAAFGFHGLRRLLLQTGLLFLLSMFYAGLILFLSRQNRFVSVYMQNTVPYADLSLIVLLAGAAAASGISVFLARRKGTIGRAEFQLHLRISGCDLCMPAFSDTGSTLRDAYSGLPVIVCSEASLHAWLVKYPDLISAVSDQKGFRLVPVRTVAGQSLLPAFIPELVAVVRTERKEVPLGAMLAVSDQPCGEIPAVVPASLLAGLS